MKQLIQKMAVMSVTFVLLCVNVIAKDENNINNLTRSSDGVTVDRSNVTLTPDVVEEVTITLEEGYAHPFLIHGGNNFDIDDVIIGDFYIAVIHENKIKILLDMNADLKNEYSDVIYVKALKIHNNSTRETREVLGVPINITYTPNSKQ